jgi:hypothetical protein
MGDTAHDVGTTVEFESTANWDNPARPLFRAAVYRDGELVDGTPWTTNPVKAIGAEADYRRIYAAWLEVQESFALSA